MALILLRPPMPLLRVCGSTIFAFIIWSLIKRLRAPKSPLAHIRGPRKEHWLKGKRASMAIPRINLNTCQAIITVYSKMVCAITLIWYSNTAGQLGFMPFLG